MKYILVALVCLFPIMAADNAPKPEQMTEVESLKFDNLTLSFDSAQKDVQLAQVKLQAIQQAYVALTSETCKVRNIPLDRCVVDGKAHTVTFGAEPNKPADASKPPASKK